MKLVATVRFKTELSKIAKGKTDLATKVAKKLQLLLTNPNHPSLRLHKLSGSNNYSISVDMSIRIIIHFSGDYVYMLKIGTHDNIY